MRADQRGMGRYVRAVLRRLAREPHVALTLLVRDPRNAPAYRAIVGDTEVVNLTAAARRTDFTCVWYPWNGMRFAARAPAIVTINDDFAFAYPARGRVARWREQRPILRAVARAAHILTISDWSRTVLAGRFALDPQRISVIPLAPDDFFSPGSETSPYAEPFVLAVGTHEARKNVAFLIDVFERAFNEHDIRLVVIGKLDAAARQTASARKIRLTECTNVDDECLRRLYRTAAAVAVPSLAEGFGLVAAEAQACGAAVIAANSSALPETVGSAGILIDLHDRSAWSNALRTLVRDNALNAYYRAQGAARWPPESPDRTTRAVLTVFEHAVDDRA